MKKEAFYKANIIVSNIDHIETQIRFIKENWEEMTTLQAVIGGFYRIQTLDMKSVMEKYLGVLEIALADFYKQLEAL